MVSLPQIDLSLPASSRITAAVRSLYERYPYPSYPLLAKPRWQEGWLTSCSFNSALAGSLTGDTVKAVNRRILIAGCGEILPAVICANEPFANRIDAVDLSRKSIRRAMFRCASELYRLRFQQSDFINLLEHGKTKYDHIDCYGVLHHLANPVSSLETLFKSMNPGATARIMVYNSAARSWIHQWQLVFKNLKLSTSHTDVAKAAKILFSASQISPKLAALLGQMGPSIFKNRTRFADTFLHPREARVSAEQWFEGLSKSGFRLVGLFDRYEECDDIPNPLWGIKEEAIEKRIASGRFANNIEILIQKPGGNKFSFPKQKSILFTALSTPPKAWFNTVETAGTPKLTLQYIWRMHHRYLGGKKGELPSTFLQTLPILSLQRLARLGAILPQQIGYDTLQVAKKPMVPIVLAQTTGSHNLDSAAVDDFIDGLCAEHSVSDRYKPTISARLRRAIVLD